MKNYLANSKKILICCCALLLVAILITCIFGFNLGKEFNGYIEVKVNIGQYSDLSDEYEKNAKEEVLNVLKDNGAEIIMTNIEGSNFTSVLTVSVKKISNGHSENLDFAKKLRIALENHYNDDMYVVTTSLVSGVMTDANLIKVAYTLLITTICMVIYMIFRIKLLNTICVMATSFSSVIMLLVLTTLTRVQINLNFIGIVVLTLALSMILAFLKITKITNPKRKEDRFNSITLDEVGNVTLTDLKTIMFALIIIADIVMIILGSTILKGYAIATIFALISIWLTDNFVCLPLAYYLGGSVGSKKVEVAVKKITEQKTENEEGTNN